MKPDTKIIPAECAVCTSPIARPMVPSLLECGATLEEMVTHTGLSNNEIETHLGHAAATRSIAAEDSVGDPIKISDARLDILLHRAHETYVAAGLQSDTKTQVSALGTQLRLELEFRRREEAKAACRRAQPLTHDPNTWPEEDRQRTRCFFRVRLAER